VAVPARDVQALADAILRFSRLRQDLRELGARARACYAANFTPQQMAAQYIDLYEACLGAALRAA
jgi:glycosyltransferase involved in cell wall biosynthesis